MPLYIFFFFLVLQLFLSLQSLLGGIKFRKYITDRINLENEGFEGLVTVIVPCCGLEPGLKKNLTAVLAQEREPFEVIFVAESENDEAVPLIRSLVSEHTNAKIVFAGKARDCGQKVFNLLAAVSNADDAATVYAFLDSDARPAKQWLESLVSPLSEESVGCSSGYRWFVQQRGGLATHLRVAWNASITSSLGENRDNNFCWGGSMAIRRSLFDELDVAAQWQGTLSDDFALTGIIKNAGYGVHFEPKCLTANVGDTTLAEFLEFSTRQMKITRVYSPLHFALSFVGSAFFTLTFFPGIMLLFWLEGFRFWFGATILVLIFVLGTGKSMLRLAAASECLGQHKTALNRQVVWQFLLWPVSTVVFLINDILALCSRKIEWRGISYELISRKETKIFRK